MATVPSFKFAVFFYPEILSELRTWMRINVPEITNENDYEVAVQLIKAFALVGHLNSVHLDAAANEAIYGTAKLLESVRQHLKLIGVEPDTATPSTAGMVLQLSKHFDVATDVVQPYAQVSTEPADNEPGVVFEYVADSALGPTSNTGRLTYIYAEEAAVFSANYASDAESGTPWTPFASLEAGDKLYFGHDSVLWFGMALEVNTPGVDYEGVWEVYIGDSLARPPGSVTDLGSTLRFGLNDVLGSTSVAGLEVRIAVAKTGVSEDLVVQWDGVDNYIETTTLLNQESPSTDPLDYRLSMEWLPQGISDDTSSFQSGGTNQVRMIPLFDYGIEWQKTEVNGVEGYWTRWRCTGIGTPTEPILAEIDTSSLPAVLAFTVTQGQRVTQEPLATGTGEVWQVYTLARTGYIGGTLEITVDGVAWSEVENFINSSSLDRHFTVEVGSEDLVLVGFGDGDNGAIPAAGAVINAYYRIGADQDGNVAARSITVNRSGIPYVTELYNWSAGVGWSEKEGADEDSLERLKIEGPAEMRTIGRACTEPDFEPVAKQYVGAGGTSPIVRAYPIINGLGPKTVALYVVGSGSDFLTSAVLEDIEDWFNGDEAKGYESRIFLNYLLGAQNFTPRTITVEAVVTARGVTAGQIKAALMTYLYPTAVHSDGVTWRWDFGEKVSRNKLIAAIDAVASEQIEDIVLTTPAADVLLNPDELPYTTNADLTITVVEP